MKYKYPIWYSRFEVMSLQILLSYNIQHLSFGWSGFWLIMYCFFYLYFKYLYSLWMTTFIWLEREQTIVLSLSFWFWRHWHVICFLFVSAYSAGKTTLSFEQKKKTLYCCSFHFEDDVIGLSLVYLSSSSNLWSIY